jgi:hypothetical protein
MSAAISQFNLVVTIAKRRTMLTGNFHQLEGSSQPPSATWLRGLRVTRLNYGE